MPSLSLAEATTLAAISHRQCLHFSFLYLVFSLFIQQDIPRYTYPCLLFWPLTLFSVPLCLFKTAPHSFTFPESAFLRSDLSDALHAPCSPVLFSLSCFADCCLFSAAAGLRRTLNGLQNGSAPCVFKPQLQLLSTTDFALSYLLIHFCMTSTTSSR